MNTVALSILSLLAREPLSGYDIKRQMNDRISRFIKVSNNQIYPQIKKMEAQQLIQLVEVTETTQKAEKKIYAITSKGIDTLKSATMQDFGDPVIKDGFMVKVNNAWLFSKDEFQAAINTERIRHVERLAMFNDKMTAIDQQSGDAAQDFASRSIITYGQMYETNYIAWLDKMSADLVSGNWKSSSNS